MLLAAEPTSSAIFSHIIVDVKSVSIGIYIIDDVAIDVEVEPTKTGGRPGATGRGRDTTSGG